MCYTKNCNDKNCPRYHGKPTKAMLEKKKADEAKMAKKAEKNKGNEAPQGGGNAQAQAAAKAKAKAKAKAAAAGKAQP